MCGPRSPIVSTAIGDKRCSGVRLTYLATIGIDFDVLLYTMIPAIMYGCEAWSLSKKLQWGASHTDEGVAEN